jgi:hypothetical protein
MNVSPFLEKVWISSRCGHDLGYGLWGELDALVLGGFDYGKFCLERCQRSNRREVKQSFGIGLCIPRETPQLWQPGTYNGQRNLALCATVQG